MECGVVERESFCERSFRQPERWPPELQSYGFLEEGGWSPSEDCENGSQRSQEHEPERVTRPVAVHAGAWRGLASSSTVVHGQRSEVPVGTGQGEWGGRGRGLSSLLTHRPTPTSGTLNISLQVTPNGNQKIMGELHAYVHA